MKHNPITYVLTILLTTVFLTLPALGAAKMLSTAEDIKGAGNGQEKEEMTTQPE